MEREEEGKEVGGGEREGGMGGRWEERETSGERTKERFYNILTVECTYCSPCALIYKIVAGTN